jgi:transcriptional regulator with XRE-family HTH domain
MSNYKTMLGEYIKSRRKELGWTQEALVKKLAARGFDYGETTISSWESARFGAPLLNENAEGQLLLDVLAQLFGVDRFELLAAAVGGLESYLSGSYEEQRWMVLYFELQPKQRTAVRLMIESFVNTT